MHKNMKIECRSGKNDEQLSTTEHYTHHQFLKAHLLFALCFTDE